MIRAAALGLPHRDIAAWAEAAHGTIRAIITRTDHSDETMTHAAESASTNGEAPEAPPAV